MMIDSCRVFVMLFLSCMAVSAAEVVGPLLGTVTTNSMRALYRPEAVPAKVRLVVKTAGGASAGESVAHAVAEQDFVAQFTVDGLLAGTDYRYEITRADGTLLAGPHAFRTRQLSSTPAKVSAAFVSCAESGPSPIWEAISTCKVDNLFLMGDTPYIDTSNLKMIRHKHASFLRLPVLKDLIRSTPTMGTWDDHDFGANNGNGHNFAHGKAKTRQGFVEYRAHERYGDGKGGIYHKVNLGPVEVFLLDPRWYSQTGPSPVDTSQKTCFGKPQWDWLLDGLGKSTATFKVLAMGAIWQDKKNRETDDMHTYWYERDALFDFIRDQQIPGVCLLGGDIHLARHLIHPKRVDYDLHDFIISPGHDHTINQLNVYNPNLEWSLVRGEQFLVMTADTTVTPPTLTVEYRQPQGVLNRTVTLNLEAMTPRPSDGLRAKWSFDNHANDSLLGKRLDLALENGASLRDGGLSGKALFLDGGAGQYAYCSRSMLYENSAAHSVSLWFRPERLPTHDSNERHFLFENTKSGEPSDASSWNLSCGFRSSKHADGVNLQLHSHLLESATKTGAAPEAVSVGPFDCDVKRKDLLNRWNHLVVTFDSSQLVLYLNGGEIARHRLPATGPSSEQGGIVIGGHRAGSGRNFHGWIDEISIWQKAMGIEGVQVLFEAYKQ